MEIKKTPAAKWDQIAATLSPLIVDIIKEEVAEHFEPNTDDFWTVCANEAWSYIRP